MGRVSLVRVFSGTLQPDIPIHVSGHGLAERGHPTTTSTSGRAISSPLGATLRTVAACPAGDICALARLVSAETGDTLSAPDDPLLVRALGPARRRSCRSRSRPRPAPTRTALATALARLVAEDPTVRLERTPRHRPAACSGAWGRRTPRCCSTGCAPGTGSPSTPMPVRVPMARPSPGRPRVTGRHVKQSGGHGQYAVVRRRGRAAAARLGRRVRAEDRRRRRCRSQFHGSVEKGVRTQTERGISGDRPLVDVHVTLVDGKAHSVDSSDAAFQAAGALALRETAAAAGTSAARALVRGRRRRARRVRRRGDERPVRTAGRVTGSEADPVRDRTTVRAEVPEIELLRYPVDLRSVTPGTGSFTRSVTSPRPDAGARGRRGRRRRGVQSQDSTAGPEAPARRDNRPTGRSGVPQVISAARADTGTERGSSWSRRADPARPSVRSRVAAAGLAVLAVTAGAGRPPARARHSVRSPGGAAQATVTDSRPSAQPSRRTTGVVFRASGPIASGWAAVTATSASRSDDETAAGAGAAARRSADAGGRVHRRPTRTSPACRRLACARSSPPASGGAAPRSPVGRRRRGRRLSYGDRAGSGKAGFRAFDA